MPERRLSGPARASALYRSPDTRTGSRSPGWPNTPALRFRGLPAARVAALAREAITAGLIINGRMWLLRAAALADDLSDTVPKSAPRGLTRPAARCVR